MTAAAALRAPDPADAAHVADLYLRLSDARSEEALDGREARLRARAAELGWAVGRVVVENDRNGDGTIRPASAFRRKRITLPGGRTGLRTVRPGFRSVLDDLLTGAATAVLTEDLDRLLRQPRDGEDLLDAVELAGATCKSLSGSLSLTSGGTAEERFVARIMAATANKASADTARRVSAKRQALAGQSYQGGRRGYGFRHDPDARKYHKNLIVVEDEARWLRAAAAGILEGDISLKAIARDMRERAAAGEPGARTVTGAAWSAKTLRDVLLKPAVAGLAVSGGTLVQAPWQAIIERDRWERLRDKLTDPSRRTNTSRANEPRWLLSGFAACGVCGGRLRACGGRNRAPAYVGDGCSHVRRNAAHADNYVASLVTERLSRPGAAGLLTPPPRPGVNAKRLRADARRLRERKAAQVRMHAAGDLDDADLAAGMREIRQRLAAVEAQLAASDAPDPLAELRDVLGQEEAAVADRWVALPVARRRAIVQVLLGHVTILPAGRRGRGFNPDSVRITWKA